MRKHAWTLFILLFAVSGCAALKTAPEAPRAISHPESIRARAIVELKRSITLNGRAVVLAKSPDSFRIEVQGPFGVVTALIVSDGQTLYILSGGESKRFDRDDPRLPSYFKPREAVSFLMGSPVSADECGCRITRDSSGRVSRMEKPSDGSPAMTVLLSDYRDVSGTELPFDIIIKGKKETLAIKYSSVEINPALDSSSFDTAGLP